MQFKHLTSLAACVVFRSFEEVYAIRSILASILGGLPMEMKTKNFLQGSDAGNLGACLPIDVVIFHKKADFKTLQVLL
jgi:hypothetical protein